MEQVRLLARILGVLDYPQVIEFVGILGAAVALFGDEEVDQRWF